MNYETGELSLLDAMNFLDSFIDRVGTESQIKGSKKGFYTVICFELTVGEVEICKDIENNL